MPGKKLLRCSGCLSANFCNASCQKAVWKQHKPLCALCKKLDVYSASPLLAAVAFLPRMQTAVKMLTYEVCRRELRGRELHLHLRNRGRMRLSPQEFDVSGRVRAGPSREQLHNMVQNDGYLEATVVGSLYGFHCAVQRYNNRHNAVAATGSGGATPMHNYVTLVHRTAMIKEYGIAIGSTCPDHALVYHVGDKVRQLQDPNNHVWMYFSSERSDQLYLDVGSLSYGMGMMFNVVDYLPEGTPESMIRRWTPALGAPAVVLDRLDLDGLKDYAAEGEAALRSGYMAERQRLPVSSLPYSTDADAEEVVRGLLQRLKEAAAGGTADSTAVTVDSTREFMGKVAAATVVTAAAAVAAHPAITAAAAAAGGAPASAAADGKRDSGSGGMRAGRWWVPFRDGCVDKHVERAMRHFEAAFNNTYAVLQQATYERYPARPDAARSFAPWVNLAALDRAAAAAGVR